MKKTKDYLWQKKTDGQRITMLTCYDFPTAQWQEEADVDVIFVGDSVGTNVLGYNSVEEVSMEDIRHHLRAVRRGVREAYLLADLPFGTYRSREMALQNARLLCDDGADGVKLEGRHPEIVSHLTTNGIEVCGHLGLTPQWHDRKCLQANTVDTAMELLHDSGLLQEAGAFMIVYELIPEEVAKEATRCLRIPSIGIGAGRFTDGQVQVVLDLLGVSSQLFRHGRQYEEFKRRGVSAIAQYVSDVSTGKFPEARNTRLLSPEQAASFYERVQQAHETKPFASK